MINDKPRSTSASGAATPRPVVDATRTAPATDVVKSATLLQGRDAITIEHHGRLYQLRQTRQGKLILTK